MNPLKKFYLFLRFRYAIKTAEELYDKHNRRQYIIPMQGKGHKLLIVDKKNFKILRAKGYLPADTTSQSLRKSALFYTPHANGSDPFPAQLIRFRFKQYIEELK